MTRTKLFVTAAALVILTAAPALAQQGTTLAGPAQGSKANGSASTHPSAESGASGATGATTGAGTTGGVATGTMSGGSTATGGNVGGPAGRN